MRKSKFDKKAEKSIIKALDAAARRYSVDDVKHGASKWLTAQRVRSSVAREKAKLEERLAELAKRMR